MVVRTQTKGQTPYPSAADLINMATFPDNFMQQYVIAYDGTKYAMVVNSLSTLKAFKTLYGGQVDPATGNFRLFESMDLKASNIEGELRSRGVPENEAKERALAVIMKDAGVTLVKAEVNSNTFKKIGAIKEFDSGGKPVYVRADCP